MAFPTPVLANTAHEALEAQITEVWGHINSATYRFLELVAEFDRTRGWVRHGLANCAQWLHWQCGINACSAREKVRVARALGDLPRISDAFRRGRVSYSKVRAMTRVATPENESTLLNIALHGTAAHVERTVRKFKRVRREMERRGAEDVHRQRCVHWWCEDDGSWRLHARLSPEVAAVVRQALEVAMEEEDEWVGDDAKNGSNGVSADDAMNGSSGVVADGALSSGDWAPDVSAETFAEAHSQGAPPFAARRADALRHMAEHYLASRADADGSSADRYQVMVHIGEEALRESGKAFGGAELQEGPEHGRELAVETARRLGCGGSLIGMVDGNDGEPLSVGRKTRAVPTAIQRALQSRDGGCRFPGCDRRRHTQAHHIRHWADGGETSLGNLVTLCHHHHRLVHEGGYGVRAGDGKIEFTRPDGRTIPACGWTARWSADVGAVSGWLAPSDRTDSCFRGNIRVEHDSVPREMCKPGAPDKLPLAAYNQRRGVSIDATTARCGWRGEVMDYGLAIERLCWESGLRI